MKLTSILLSLALLLVLSAPAQNNQDQEQIESVAKEYLTAWHQGNADLMASVVHPQMSKKIVFNAGDSSGSLAYLSANDLLEQTRRKRTQTIDINKLNADISVLDIYKNTAMVKAETKNWIDYLHLAKISGEWKIVNILWELKYEGL